MTKNELKDLGPRLEAVAATKLDFKKDGHIRMRTNRRSASNAAGAQGIFDFSRRLLRAIGYEKFLEANLGSQDGTITVPPGTMRPSVRIEDLDMAAKLLYIRVFHQGSEPGPLKSGVLALQGPKDIFEPSLVSFTFPMGLTVRLGCRLQGPVDFTMLPYHQVVNDPTLFILSLEDYDFLPTASEERAKVKQQEHQEAETKAKAKASAPVAVPALTLRQKQQPVAEPAELSLGQLIAKLNEKFRAMAPGEVEVDVIKGSDGRQTIRARRTETFE